MSPRCFFPELRAGKGAKGLSVSGEITGWGVGLLAAWVAKSGEPVDGRVTGAGAGMAVVANGLLVGGVPRSKETGQPVAEAVVEVLVSVEGTGASSFETGEGAISIRAGGYAANAARPPRSNLAPSRLAAISTNFSVPRICASATLIGASREHRSSNALDIQESTAQSRESAKRSMGGSLSFSRLSMEKVRS